MTEHDIELAKQAGFTISRDEYVFSEMLAKYTKLIRAEKPQGEAVAYVHINEYGEYRLEPLDTFKIVGFPKNVDIKLYTTPPDQGEEITKLKNILRLRRLLFNARESRLREALKNCAESLKGYRREMNCNQACDAEKIAIEILENT
jgi:hypothetical protein